MSVSTANLYKKRKSGLIRTSKERFPLGIDKHLTIDSNTSLRNFVRRPFTAVQEEGEGVNKIFGQATDNMTKGVVPLESTIGIEKYRQTNHTSCL